MSKRRFILFALVAALVLGFAGVASAAIWEGAVGDNWNDDAHWDGNVPDVGDVDVVIPAGSRVVVDVDTAALESLTIGHGSTITINAGFALNLAGGANVGIVAEGDVTITGGGSIDYAAANNNATSVEVAGNNSTLTVNVPINVPNDGALFKTGAGTLALRSTIPPDAATEPTISVLGTLVLANEELVSATGAITLADEDARLVLTGGEDDEDFTFADGGREIFLANGADGATIVIDAGTEVILGGNGGNAVASDGADESATVIVSGDLVIRTAGADAFDEAPSVEVDGGTLTIEAAADDSNVFNNLTGDGDVVIDNDLTIAPAAGTDAFEFSGNISGLAGLTYDGRNMAVADAFTLSGTNSYEGDTTVDTGDNAGRLGLRLDGADALPTLGILILGDNAAGVVTVSGDLALDCDIEVANNGGILNVPGADVTLTLTGELEAAGELEKRGTGTLALEVDVVPGADDDINVTAGTLRLVRNGVADGINLTVGAAGTLELGAPGNQSHTPRAGNAGADTFTRGARFVANLTEDNLVKPDGTATPYLHVDGRLAVDNANSVARIVVNFTGSMKAGEELLVLDYTTNTPAGAFTYANATNFRAVRPDATNTTDTRFEVVDRIVRGSRGIALLAREDIEAPAVSAYEISDPVLAADLKTITFRFLKDGVTDAGLNGTFDYAITLGATPETDGTGVAVAAGVATITLDDELEPNETYTLTVSGIADYEGKSGEFGYYPTASQPQYPSASDYTWAAEGSEAADGEPIFDTYFKLNASETAIEATIYDPRLAALSSQRLWVWVVTPSGSDGDTHPLGSVTPVPVSGKPGYYTLTVPVSGLSDAVLEAAAKDFAVYYQAVEDPSVRANSPKQSISTGGGNGGGGCDAGFGLFGLLAATGAVALLRRKG